jgi:NAD(P)-dependent dehydrogenase (short-subunit alcohol dehydrogenase family)
MKDLISDIVKAMVGMSRSLAIEVAMYNITVNNEKILCDLPPGRRLFPTGRRLHRERRVGA